MPFLLISIEDSFVYHWVGIFYKIFLNCQGTSGLFCSKNQNVKPEHIKKGRTSWTLNILIRLISLFLSITSSSSSITCFLLVRVKHFDLRDFSKSFGIKTQFLSLGAAVAAVWSQLQAPHHNPGARQRGPPPPPRHHRAEDSHSFTQVSAKVYLPDIL